MRILNRYIAKNVMTATGLVLAVLIGLDTFMLFFGEMSDVGRSNYTVLKACLYVLMQLPFDIYQLFPMAGFLGCLIGLGRLASQSELIVMRASGVSIFQITFAVIKAAVLMLFVITVLGELTAPKLEIYSERMKAVALAKGDEYANMGGIWLRHENTFIHMGDIINEESAREVTVFQFKQHELVSISYAPYAKRVKPDVWQLDNVTQTHLTSEKTISERLKTLLIDIQLDPLVLSLGNRSVEQLSMKGLFDSIKYRNRSGLYVEQYELAFWQRLFQPLATLVMICLGVPFIFGSLRNATMGSRILIGIIIGFIFYIMNQLLGPLAIVYQLSPIVAALIPAIIFVGVCVVLFRRVN